MNVVEIVKLVFAALRLLKLLGWVPDDPTSEGEELLNAIWDILSSVGLKEVDMERLAKITPQEILFYKACV
jgi:hypothetical protein